MRELSMPQSTANMSLPDGAATQVENLKLADGSVEEEYCPMTILETILK